MKHIASGVAAVKRAAAAMPLLRRIAIPLLARLRLPDVRVRHHWTGEDVWLDPFRHRGYWYYGAERERLCMSAFAALIRPGDTVIDVGAHIGYVAMYLARLAGPLGRMVALEPSPENLRYARRNVSALSNALLLPVAAAQTEGEAQFFVEDLSGQNCTLEPGLDLLGSNVKRAFVERVYRSVTVQTTTLDLLSERMGITPAFVKIDVEGAEWEVLQGMVRLLGGPAPTLMVEVSAHHSAIADLLEDHGYSLRDESLLPASPRDRGGNFFALSPSRGDSVSPRAVGLGR